MLAIPSMMHMMRMPLLWRRRLNRDVHSDLLDSNLVHDAGTRVGGRRHDATMWLLRRRRLCWGRCRRSIVGGSSGLGIDLRGLRCYTIDVGNGEAAAVLVGNSTLRSRIRQSRHSLYGGCGRGDCARGLRVAGLQGRRILGTILNGDVAAEAVSGSSAVIIRKHVGHGELALVAVGFGLELEDGAVL